MVQSVMDEMLEYLNSDGIIQVSFSIVITCIGIWIANDLP